jgi:hypothetical protein
MLDGMVNERYVELSSDAVEGEKLRARRFVFRSVRRCSP